MSAQSRECRKWIRRSGRDRSVLRDGDQERRQVKLLNVTKRIRLLSITKLLTVFECHDSEGMAEEFSRGRFLLARSRGSKDPPYARQ